MNRLEIESKKKKLPLSADGMSTEIIHMGSYVLYVHKMGTYRTSTDLHRLFTQQWI